MTHVFFLLPWHMWPHQHNQSSLQALTRIMSSTCRSWLLREPSISVQWNGCSQGQECAEFVYLEVFWTTIVHIDRSMTFIGVSFLIARGVPEAWHRLGRWNHGQRVWGADPAESDTWSCASKIKSKSDEISTLKFLLLSARWPYKMRHSSVSSTL